MELFEFKRLKSLEDENARLKSFSLKPHWIRKYYRSLQTEKRTTEDGRQAVGRCIDVHRTERISKLKYEHWRWGYRRIDQLFRDEALYVNHKHLSGVDIKCRRRCKRLVVSMNFVMNALFKKRKNKRLIVWMISWRNTWQLLSLCEIVCSGHTCSWRYCVLTSRAGNDKNRLEPVVYWLNIGAVRLWIW